MPDITMCASSGCPLATTCRRSEASGTKPRERQLWAEFEWIDRVDSEGVDGEVYCDFYLPLNQTVTTGGTDNG